jgi:adenine deaminase
MTTSCYSHSRKQLSAVTADLAAVAMGRLAPDLLILHGTLVNVNVGYTQPNTDVAVKHGFIAYVGSATHILRDSATVIVDATNKFLVPGFIDGHMHIESAMVDPRHFAAGVLPHGVTTICPDNHEITNVFGLRAVSLFHTVSEDLPIKFLLAMPVCVPSVPGLEESGATITAADVTEAYAKGWAQLQGEQMNFPGLMFGDPHVHAITAASLDAGVVLTGHYTSLELDRGLNAFAATGQVACHEVSTPEGVLRRAELGISPQIRHATAWLDLPACIRAYTENPGIDTRLFTLVTDDMTAATICEEGQLLRVVRTAIRHGVPPIKAIQFVTINTAQLLEKARWIGSISPSRAADILIVSDLAAMTIDEVYSDGVLVAKAGKLTVQIGKYDYPEWALKSVHLGKLSVADFRIPAPAETVKVRVMSFIEGSVYTTEEIVECQTLNGELVSDSGKDLAKAFSFYRHEPKEGVTGTRGAGLVKGIHFRANCAYASTVAHDCHNLTVIGTSDEAMVVAANELISIGGGICIVVDGKVDAVIALPLGGLMSLESCEVVAEKVHAIEAALKRAGCPHENFEMTLSLMALIVINELHLSNRGIVEFKGGQAPHIVDLFVQE